MRELDYLKWMSREYPNVKSTVSEIVNLRAIMGLPKGTEYFFSDLHGEHVAFLHLLRSSSGMIREKIRETFRNIIFDYEERELADLIHYPEKHIDLKKSRKEYTMQWESLIIYRLIQVLKVVSSKYTRSKVRKRMPEEFAYIIDELLHVDNRDKNKENYYGGIIKSIIEIDAGEKFIVSLCYLIQKMTVDHLHIIGDIFDRGPRADVIMDELMKFPEVDIQWGNHDIEWMGAAGGHPALVCSVLRVAFGYNNFDILEDGYGINLRPLSMFASKVYQDDPCERFQPKIFDENKFDYIEPNLAAKMHKAIAVIMFKLEGAIIKRHPEFDMDCRLLLDKIDYQKGVIRMEGQEYELLDRHFPTIDPKDPYALTKEESDLVEILCTSFRHSLRMNQHMKFLYSHGSLYLKYNQNLLYHGCIPMKEDGSFDGMQIGEEYYQGKNLLDKLDRMIQEAYLLPDSDEKKTNMLDMMWYLWCGKKSPLFGKSAMKTFENYFLEDPKLKKEVANCYYRLYEKEEEIEKIFHEFGMHPQNSHIVNGHVPVKIKDGESPMKAGGKLFVIDGGLSKPYQKKTGIAGYTLIFTSKKLVLAEHQPYNPENEESARVFVAKEMENRIRVADTDAGREIQKRIEDLKLLKKAYEDGVIKERL